MKNKLINRKQRLAFSLMEILVAIVLIGILSTGLMVVTGTLSKNAKDKMKESNARTMNRVLASIRAAGGEVGDGKAVDTTSINTLIKCLCDGDPINVDGIEFKVDPKPNPKDYELDGTTPNKKVKAILNQEAS